MTDPETYIQSLLVANPLREPLLRAAIQALHLPPGSRGLDAGCGIGLQTLLLLDAVGSSGHITGLDILPELLAYGQELVERAGFASRITFREGDVAHLPFEDDRFDWAWSVDCIGYPAGDLAPLLEELMRVVRPAGRLAILGWSSQQLLPGYPLLEARLNGTCSGYAPLLQGKSPDQNYFRALHALRKAGLQNVRAQTFVWDVQAPLSGALRAAVESLFSMLWVEPGREVSRDDWQECLRLCRPESPDFILDVPDYYGFFTYSLFQGQVPDRG